MALSNILKEPRREITESVIGIAIFSALAWADYLFGCRIESWAGYDAHGWAHLPWFIGMLLGVLLAFGIAGLLFITHGIGNTACNLLENNGFQIRPQRRIK